MFSEVAEIARVAQFLKTLFHHSVLFFVFSFSIACFWGLKLYTGITGALTTSLAGGLVNISGFVYLNFRQYFEIIADLKTQPIK